MDLRNCHNFHDFRRRARRRLPGPIFDYFDGAAGEETSLRRNTEAFESCDLVPSALRGVERVDLSVTVMGQMQQPEAYIGGADKLFDATGKLSNDATRNFLADFLKAFAGWVGVHASKSALQAST